MRRMRRAGTTLDGTPGRPLVGARSWVLLALSLLLASASWAQQSAAPAAEPAGDVAPTLAEPAPATEPALTLPVHAPAPPPPPQAPPDDLRRVGDWVQWKNARQITSLPSEARLFYRRGLLAQQSGQRAEALEDVRGAAELDPSFMAPHLTLASWLALEDPAASLHHVASALGQLRRDWSLQLDLIANVLILGLEALYAGLLIAGLILVFLHRDELQHAIEEQLGVWISPLTARWWAPVVLLIPFLAGLGLTLPVLWFQGLLWPRFRVREQVLTVLLAVAAMAAPFVPRALDPFTLTLRTEAAAFHEMPALQHAPWDEARQARLERAQAQHPNDGFAAFALGWHSRRGGQLEEAERAYEAALRAWPDHAAVLTDLGNVAAMRGHSDRALELYRRAVKSDSSNAAAHFNASQLLTRRFEYEDANAALQRASSLDFDLVKSYQARAGESGLLPLIDVWLGPEMLWSAWRSRPSVPPQPLPLTLRGHLETSSALFSVAALVLLAGGLALGQWQERRLPLRRCTYCDVVVCRRCAKRRREAALCERCEKISAGASTSDYSRVLLLQHRTRSRDRGRAVATVFATLVPGYGLLAHRRVFTPVLLIAATWCLGRLALGEAQPFALSPRLALPGTGMPAMLLWGGILFLYLWSLIAYLVVTRREREREAALGAVAIGRITQATRRSPERAA